MRIFSPASKVFKAPVNYAFIDNQNLHKEIEGLGWHVDWRRFRVYLREKYNVTKAYMFLGYLVKNRDLYRYLEGDGYILIFKEIVRTAQGEVKGNIDAELVLQAMIDWPHYQQAVIVSGDGDFACLIRYLVKNNKLCQVIVPNQYKYSVLIKRAAGKQIESMNSLREKLAYMERTP